MPGPKLSSLKDRFFAAGWHLLISAGIAALAAGLVFGLWYPGVFRQLAGGRELFLLVVSVDVVLGPLLTFAVFNRAKGWPHLRRDLAVIAALQLAALGYGMHTVYVARPVALVFEVDRLRLISALDVYEPELVQARPEYRQLPLTGPWLLSLRDAQPGAEKTDALMMALDQGVDMGQRPKFWQPYELSRAAVLAKSRPLNLLLTRYPHIRASVQEALAAQKTDAAAVRFLPLTGTRKGDWVALIDAQGRPVHYVPVDGFF